MPTLETLWPAAALVCLTIHSSSVLAADNFKQLNASQIKAAIIGKSVTDDAHWSDHFYADGTLISLDLGETKRGAWALRGSELCLTRNDKKNRTETECSEVWMAGERIEYQRFGVTAAEGVIKPQW